MTAAFDLTALTELIARQDRVLARRQILAMGGRDHDIARWVRRRELTPSHPGVYVTHTGPLTRHQREWAAVLACWPAALSHQSALPFEDPELVHVAIDRHRRVLEPSGVCLHRTIDLDRRVLWNRSPPRIAVEHAALDVAALSLDADRVHDGFAVLARACGSRRTTAARIAAAAQSRTRLPHRATLRAMLDDLEHGACSVLERGYVHRVERPHGLPTGTRQRLVRVGGRTTYSDVDYDPYGLTIELDGLAFHGGPRDRDRDAERDLLKLATSGDLTVRLTYGLVFGTPCRTAAGIAGVLQQRGWTGSLVRCPACRLAA